MDNQGSGDDHPYLISLFAPGAEIAFLTCWLICTIRAGSFIAARSITAIGTGSGTSSSVWRRSYSLGSRRPVHKPYGRRGRSTPCKRRPQNEEEARRREIVERLIRHDAAQRLRPQRLLAVSPMSLATPARPHPGY